MSSDIPFSLQRLSLGGDADVGMIRRAYARELKLIDQQSDAAGFQDLRGAYEHALAWAKRSATPDVPPAQPSGMDGGVQLGTDEAASHASDSVPSQDRQAEDGAPLAGPGASDGQVASRAIAESLFAQFSAASAALLATGRGQDLDGWVACLENILDDPQLLDIAARTMFESRIAMVLAAGWRPGNEALFVAACQVFDWMHDQRRVSAHGDAGRLLCRAIDEYAMFQAQSEGVRAAQRKAIARLRDAALPTKGEIRIRMQHVEDLAMRFPNWLYVICDVSNIAQWRALASDVSGWQRTSGHVGGGESRTANGPGNVWTIVIAAIFILQAVARCSGG